MRSIAGAAVAALSICAIPAHAETTEDFQLWSSLNVGTDLSSKWVGDIEISARLADNASRVGVAIVSPSVGYRVDDRLTLHIGYTRQSTINPGMPDVDENRFFQQTSWRIGKLGGPVVMSRTRIELRTIERAHDTGWRLRQRLRLQLPLKADGTRVILSSEAMFALNSTDWGARAGFDQVRNFLGVSVPLSAGWQVETGFQHRYQRRVGLHDRSDFVLPLTLSVRI